MKYEMGYDLLII